jgi:hypothetical protein
MRLRASDVPFAHDLSQLKTHDLMCAVMLTCVPNEHLLSHGRKMSARLRQFMCDQLRKVKALGAPRSWFVYEDGPGVCLGESESVTVCSECSVTTEIQQ